MLKKRKYIHETKAIFGSSTLGLVIHRAGFKKHLQKYISAFKEG
jgi:hypothetical protein